MNTKPSVLFGKNASVAKNLLTPLITGGVTAGGLDYLQNKDNYSDVTPSRIGLGVVNLLTGALGGNLIRKGDVTKGLGTVLLAPTKDVALAAIPALHGLQKSQDEIAKTQEHIRKPFLDKLSPTEKTIIGGAGVLGTAALIPMILNMSRAAKRVGEGKVIRVSTSLRKRPNQDTDLNVGVIDLPEEESEDLSKQEEKPKGLIKKLFNI
jgi:hypothetical protein